MTSFPYDDQIRIGSVLFARRVIHRDETEEGILFGPWQNETVLHVQRDPGGRISTLVIFGFDAEFDPRHDWNSMATNPCLMSEDRELQIERVVKP